MSAMSIDDDADIQQPIIDDPAEARRRALKLIETKDAKEKELSSLHSALQDQNAELGQSLIDGEGFPRADIDVYNVRLTRVRVIELRGDIKALSEEIKTLLEVALARPAAGESSSGGVASTSESGVAVARPFALCNGVAPGSPAAQAGMLQGDKLVRFGSIDAENNQNLRAVATETQNNEGRTVTISILRQSSETSGQESPQTLILTPQKWSGRGLLGCHIVPI